MEFNIFKNFDDLSEKELLAKITDLENKAYSAYSAGHYGIYEQIIAHIEQYRIILEEKSTKSVATSKEPDIIELGTITRNTR